MDKPRTRSSTKRENLVAYWLDAETGRLRGYPPIPPVPIERAEEKPEEVAERGTEATTEEKPRKSGPEVEADGMPAQHLEPGQSIGSVSPHWLRAGNTVDLTDRTGWKSRLDPESTRAVLVVRDRFGFRWERTVGLEDDVSQVEAARLLGIPLSRLNRWIRTGKLKSRSLNGYSVIRARDLYQLAVDMKLEVPRGRPFGIVGVAKTERNDSRAPKEEHRGKADEE